MKQIVSTLSRSGRFLLKGAVVAIGLVLLSQAAFSQPFAVPPISLPNELLPYTNEARTSGIGRSVLGLLKDAKMSRHTTGMWSGGAYTDTQYPRRVADTDGIKYVVERSPCEDDAEAMAIHRGWAWIAVAYNLFGRSMEGLDTAGPKFTNGKKSAQSIDLAIASFGRSILIGALKAETIGHLLQDIGEGSRALPTAVRSDVRSFLKALLQFRPYYDALDKNGERIRDLLYLASMSGPKPKEAARDLLRRMNTLRPSAALRLSACMEGYVEHIVTLADGRVFESGSIFSGGIATYGVGFWWRRDREGTTGLADAALRWTVGRLSN